MSQSQLKMDRDLILDIFRIPNPSRYEQEIAEYIKGYLESNGIPFQEDSTGNIFNVSYDKRPILMAHMDSVQDRLAAQLSRYATISSDMVWGHLNIGADDKCGILIILHLLVVEPELNFCFTVGEEIGMCAKGLSRPLGRRALVDAVAVGIPALRFVL